MRELGFAGLVALLEQMLAPRATPPVRSGVALLLIATDGPLEQLHAPRVLALHLKRFSLDWGTMRRVKLGDAVAIPPVPLTHTTLGQWLMRVGVSWLSNFNKHLCDQHRVASGEYRREENEVDRARCSADDRLVSVASSRQS